MISGLPYFTCSSCGAKSLHPVPDDEDLRAYYNKAYKVPLLQAQKGVSTSAPKVLGLMEHGGAVSGDLLEIGCSYGFFLSAARKRGWKVTGIEIDSEAAMYARNQLSLNIHSGTLQEALPRLHPP